MDRTVVGRCRVERIQTIARQRARVAEYFVATELWHLRGRERRGDAGGATDARLRGIAVEAREELSRVRARRDPYIILRARVFEGVADEIALRKRARNYHPVIRLWSRDEIGSNVDERTISRVRS